MTRPDDTEPSAEALKMAHERAKEVADLALMNYRANHPTISSNRQPDRELHALILQAAYTILQRDALALNRFRAAGVREEREECAKVADQYAENPPSHESNNTQDAFDQGMDHQAGCIDAADLIAAAIRRRVAP